ncbi:MAG: S8 family serine peptidase, partial [Candidatus Omnitrophota bacterium]
MPGLIKKTGAIVILLLSLIARINSFSYAWTNYTNEDKTKDNLRYLPHELIVHMKANTQIEDIGELNKKYGIISIRKLFRETAAPQEKLEGFKRALSALNSEHSRWYWQMDQDSQEYKDYMKKAEIQRRELEKRIKAQSILVGRLNHRQKRAPQEISAPDLNNIYILKLASDEDILTIAKEYSAQPSVEQANPNYIKEMSYVPSDPLYSKQWAHKVTEAEDGWDIEKGSSEVVIAILDTGIDYQHEDLAGNIWRDLEGNPGIDLVNLDEDYLAEMKEDGSFVEGEDYTDIDNDPSDWDGHGTHCAGITAAVGENNRGVIGVSPNCKIMPVRIGYSYLWLFFIPTALVDDEAYVNGVKYAVDNGADIISMSFGNTVITLEEEKILNYAASQGVILVAAAGNESNDKPHYPSGLDVVIGVGATAENDSRTSYSNYGSSVDLAAPGGDRGSGILSTVMTDGFGLKDPSGYGMASGTSMAAPYVAGVAGLCLSHYPEEVSMAIRTRITATT